MKYILVFILLLTNSSIFAAPATKDDIKMLIQQMDKRFEDVNRRFEDVNRRFEDVNKRFEDMQKYTNKHFEDMNKRFEDMNKRFEDMNRRFESLTNILIFCFSVLAASMGFLYHRQSSMMKSIGGLESSVQAILERMERTDASIQAILERLERIERPQVNLNHHTIDVDALVLTLQNSDEQTKRKLREVLEVH